VLPKAGAFTQFQYPIPSKAKLALDDTAATAYADAEASLNWINATPLSPYSPEHVMEITGHQFGIRELRPPQRTKPVLFQRETKVGRNDQCRCGSGKKYKKCCGAA
jgi:hypothetical protein